MRSKAVAAAVLALMLGAIDASAQAMGKQFTLRCTGTRTQMPPLDAKPEGVTFEIHVDLNSLEYCFDDCESVLEIVGATPSTITFSKRDDLRLSHHARAYAEIDRRSGRYVNSYVRERPTPAMIKTEAVCAAKPFKPFPAAKF